MHLPLPLLHLRNDFVCPIKHPARRRAMRSTLVGRLKPLGGTCRAEMVSAVTVGRVVFAADQAGKRDVFVV